MTVGDRNFNVVRLHESGLTNRKVAEMMGCSESTVERTLNSYKKDGDEMFKDTKEARESKAARKMSSLEKRAKELNVKIMPSEEEDDLGIREDGFLSEYNKKLIILKRTLKVGDSVKIGNGKTMVVEQIHPYLVYGHNRMNPCWICKEKSKCKMECDRHKEYMYFRVPITMTYVQLLEVGNR